MCEVFLKDPIDPPKKCAGPCISTEAGAFFMVNATKDYADGITLHDIRSFRRNSGRKAFRISDRSIRLPSAAACRRWSKNSAG